MRQDLRVAGSRFIAAGLGFAFAAGGAAAGDFTSKQKGGTLSLRGEGVGLEITLQPPLKMLAPRGGGAAGILVVIAPEPGTTVDGGTVPVTFEDVEDVKITIVESASSVTIETLAFPGSLTWKSGDGADQLVLDAASFADDVKVSFGDGVNSLSLGATGTATPTVGDDLSLKSGDGVDDAALAGHVGGKAKLTLGNGVNTITANNQIDDSVSFTTGSGVDEVVLSDVSYGLGLTMKLGDGVNNVTIDTTSAIGESLKISMKNSVDTINLTDVLVGDDTLLVLGDGNNTVNLTDVGFGDDLTVKAKDGDDTVTANGAVTVGGEPKFLLGIGQNMAPAL